MEIGDLLNDHWYVGVAGMSLNDVVNVVSRYASYPFRSTVVILAKHCASVRRMFGGARTEVSGTVIYVAGNIEHINGISDDHILYVLLGLPELRSEVFALMSDPDARMLEVL